jgi:D-alanyl-lipoteichoic acid acyltransferase DltB (MBOAT superfamily)
MPRVLSSIGMSFYTFQALSYSNDIYREIQIPEAHLGRFALYVCFFPKLLQGPIERAGGLLIQLRKPFEFDYENTREGLLRIAWGLFKKVVIADRVAVIVNTVYGNAGGFTGLPLIVATYSYAIQIYTDFSGYTDIALGTARLFNIRLTENFNKPYFAQGVADFWRRWHISLSSWLLDYIFRPLQWRWRDLRLAGPFMALLVTFLVSGAWHGASWNFILWGLLHGLFIAAGESVDKYRK